MSTTQRSDKWEQSLDEELAKLERCQLDRGLDSCLACLEFDECLIRNSYIKAVYESMSKGKGGGFEF